MKTKSILVVDDHTVVRKGIRQIIEDEDYVRQISEAGSAKETLDLLKEFKFDLIILDISLPDRNGLDLFPLIKKISPSTLIIIMSIHSDELYILSAFKAGVNGYLSKSGGIEELNSAIRSVLRGEKYLSPLFTVKLIDLVLNENSFQQKQKLSVRELEVLDLYAKGLSVKNMADELSLSPKTISTYRRRLLAKLNLTSSGELVRYGLLNNH